MSVLPYLVLAFNSDSSNKGMEKAGEEERKPAKLKFCQSCGSTIPFVSRFCPNCGISVEKKPAPLLSPREEQGAPRIFQKFMNRRRSLLVLLSLILLFVFTFIGSQTSLDPDYAAQLIDDMNKVFGPRPSLVQILFNNAYISLLLFIPVYGTYILTLASHNTGLLLSALAQFSDATSMDFFWFIVGAPWTWFEFTAFSIASAQSIMLLFAVYSRNIRKEAKNILISLTICLGLLGLGAILEIALI